MAIHRLLEIVSIGCTDDGEVIVISFETEDGATDPLAIHHSQMQGLIEVLLRGAGAAAEKRDDDVASGDLKLSLVHGVQGGSTDDGDLWLGLTVQGERLNFLVPRMQKAPNGKTLFEALCQIVDAVRQRKPRLSH